MYAPQQTIGCNNVLFAIAFGENTNYVMQTWCHRELAPTGIRKSNGRNPNPTVDSQQQQQQQVNIQLDASNLQFKKF